MEITARAVTAVALGRGGGDLPTLARHATVALPAGAVVPALNAQNLIDRSAVAAAIKQVLGEVGRPRRIGLVVPDPVARLSIVRLDTVPARSEDRDQLVRFQVRKAAPFAADLAHCSIEPGRKVDGGGQEFVVALARRDVIEEYERACDGAGAHAGIVDLATCSVLNLVARGRRAIDAGGQGDWMLVHLAPSYSTVVIVRDDTPILFRNRGPEADGLLVDVVHQSAMYYEDRLGGTGFRRVIVAGQDGGDGTPGELDRVLRDRLKSDVEVLDLRQAVALTDRIDLSQAAGGPARTAGRPGPARGRLMLRLNLSTRPFYNERGVHVALIAIAVLLAVVSALNIQAVRALSARQTALQTRLDEDRARAEDARRRALKLRGELNQEELERVLAEAKEANLLIDRRTFSWTELFNHLEATLPADVMLRSVQPASQEGRMVVSLGLVARKVEDIEKFMERLEETKAFADLLATSESAQEDGSIQAIVVGSYLGVATIVAQDAGVAAAQQAAGPATAESKEARR